MIKKQIDNRLKQLGWKAYHLAKLVAEIRGSRGVTTTALRLNSTITKALDNPTKSSLSTLEDIVTALGGTLQIAWNIRTGVVVAPTQNHQLYLVKTFEKEGVRVKTSTTIGGAISQLLLNHSKKSRAEIWRGDECLWSSDDIQIPTTQGYTVVAHTDPLPNSWLCFTK